MYYQSLFPLVFICFCFFSCNNSIEAVKAPEDIEAIDDMEKPDPSKLAAVLSVAVSGNEGRYTFNVEIGSPDTGCDQYADWWEVIDENGQLKYRRILAHSHVNEQPFKRSGGPVPVNADDRLFVRAHMNNTGYGIEVMSGSVQEGFKEDSLEVDFAVDLAKEDPLPADCDF